MPYKNSVDENLKFFYLIENGGFKHALGSTGPNLEAALPGFSKQEKNKLNDNGTRFFVAAFCNLLLTDLQSKNNFEQDFLSAYC